MCRREKSGRRTVGLDIEYSTVKQINDSTGSVAVCSARKNSGGVGYRACGAAKPLLDYWRCWRGL